MTTTSDRMHIAATRTTTRVLRCAAAVGIAFAISSASSESQGQPDSVPDDVVIKLERTRCFGACPVYTVSIDAKGNVVYEGIRFVQVQGRVTDRIPVSRVAALLATADRIGFFELGDQYRTKKNPDGSETIVTDLPTTFVTITSGGRTKRIEDYYGGPDSLKELERQIDDAAGTKRWIRAQDRLPQTSLQLPTRTYECASRFATARRHEGSVEPSPTSCRRAVGATRQRGRCPTRLDIDGSVRVYAGTLSTPAV
jgi:hypothetical protein